MNKINYQFTELDSDASFALFSKFFGGILKDQTIYFDNHFARGEVTKLELDGGLCARRWRLSVYQKILLQKVSCPFVTEKKFGLIYFLNPGLFDLKGGRKKIRCNSHRNNLFYCNKSELNFSVTPGYAFYAFDIAFTESWLLKQLGEVLNPFKKGMDQFLNTNNEIVLMQPCIIEDYKALHELEFSNIGKQDLLFIRARIYNLVATFLHKYFTEVKKKVQCTIQYEKIMRVADIIQGNLHKYPNVGVVAKDVNMSVASLLRQFRLIYGKGIYKYHLENKMELAKKMMYEHRLTVKETANTLGYKQASPFIESFIKHHGVTPGKMTRTGFR